MAVRVLNIDIMSYLKGDGFKKVDTQVGKVRASLNNLKAIGSSPLFKMAAGYFGINTLIGQYNKAIEASNFQLEQETKLYATLKGQNFRDEQIESIKKYASELQKIGVVGDEVTLAGAQQLATYNLTEKNLKALLPAMQDVIVQQKGLNGTGQDAVGVANMLAKGLLGQTGILQKAGITLTKRQESLIKLGNQEEKVAALVEAVRMNVGEQNKEFFKMPEGKILSAQNRIGDVYEYLGSLVRNTRAHFWTSIADNEEVIKSFLGGIFKAGSGIMDTFLTTTNFLFDTFKKMPTGVKTSIKLLASFFMLTNFPIASAIFVIEDIFSAFQGKESFTEDAMNAIFKFTGTDYRFKDLKKEVNDFWHDLTSPADEATEKIGGVTASLEILLETLRGGAGLLEIIFGTVKAGTWDLGVLIGKTAFDPSGIENHINDFNNGGVKTVKAGWDLLLKSGENTNKILDRYEANFENRNIKIGANDLNKAIKRDTERFQYQLPVQIDNKNTYETSNKFFLGNENKKNYSPSIENMEQFFLRERKTKSTSKETIGKTSKANMKLIQPKPNISYVDKTSISFSVTGDNSNEITSKIEKILREREKQKMEEIKTIYGGDYRLGALE